MMALEGLKTAWARQKTVGYSPEELNSIFHIKQTHRFEDIKSTFTWDLILALIISLSFIVALQLLDYRTSDFWSVCMAIFALQHILFYQLQVYLLRKYNVFKDNVGQSLTTAINNVHALLWFYRLWPAMLTLLLSLVYVYLFRPEAVGWVMFLIVITLAAGIGLLSNIISAVTVRKHLIKLENLKQDYLNLMITDNDAT